MRIHPISFRLACDYINANHRHHKKPQGCKFCISVNDENGRICGVAVCGRPVSRYLDNGITLEITRLCTDGTRNACSMLYGACVRIAREMGYRKVITYILESESGASLKASNFVCCGEAGGEIWTGKRNRDNGVPREKKTRWEYLINRRNDNA